MTLYNENCFGKIKDIINNANNPVIVTDPPFNIGYRYNTYKDKKDEETYLNELVSIFSLCPCVVIHYPESLHKISIKLGKAPEKVVSWVYNSSLAKQHRDIAFYDIIPDFNKVRQPYKNPNDKRIKARIAQGSTGARIYDWWNIQQVKNVSKEKTSHPCQMPLEVMKNIIGILPDNITIIDPFMGSGTTGVACKFYNKDFIGFELDKEYFEIAKHRLEIGRLFRSMKSIHDNNIGFILVDPPYRQTHLK